MQHIDLNIRKAHPLDAERLNVLDELTEIAEFVDLVALAVIGMARELGGDEGDLLANHLREQAVRIRTAAERLSACPKNGVEAMGVSPDEPSLSSVEHLRSFHRDS